ncbi:MULTISPECIES: hypothetical protein [Prevotellaceae]|uniref:hypothetical protein n=1 Tax=Xylanibacter rarus TaxID=1676614 RepID=UPI000A6916E6|nr:hypothetical protein [Xylanibacter rarus]
MIIVDTILYLIVDVIANDFGALLRFTYHKYVKREKVVYSNFQAGNTRKTRRDKKLHDDNYDKNNRWCAGFLLILAGILGICFNYF